jgi:hypothetical protein
MQKLLSVLAVTMAMAGCGAGLNDDTSSADISNVAPKCAASDFPDTTSLGYANLLRKYANDQCLYQIQNAESYRQSAIANCAAGSVSGAAANYDYYLKTVAYNKGIGCS